VAVRARLHPLGRTGVPSRSSASLRSSWCSRF